MGNKNNRFLNPEMARLVFPSFMDNMHHTGLKVIGGVKFVKNEHI